MSKIICEVCGTSYPETATQCPICGCVRSGEADAVAESTDGVEGAESRAYTYVKGGRFSKSNVRKRNREHQSMSEEPLAEDVKPVQKKSAVDKWLTAAIIVLLLSIVAVVLYIVVKFFGIGLPQSTKPAETKNPAVSTTGQTTETTQTKGTTEPEEIPCQALKLDNTTIKLDKIGASSLLNVYAEPANTTDVFTFTSSNESVATVTESGKVVAVGSGQAVITITCGEVKLECTVVCDTEEETTAPTTEPTTEPTTKPTTAPTTEPKKEFELNREDFTLAAKGESWVLYNGSIAKTEITWSSDDESVATVDGGKVVAVGPGVTTVRAEYNGTKVSCIVRCSFADEDSTETTVSDPVIDGNGGVSDGGTSAAGTATISHTDVTIAIGESFDLLLKDAEGKTLSVTWMVSGDSYCTVSGNTITGKAVGDAKVYVEYNGSEYSCIVRVKRS